MYRWGRGAQSESESALMAKYVCTHRESCYSQCNIHRNRHSAKNKDNKLHKVNINNQRAINDDNANLI